MDPQTGFDVSFIPKPKEALLPANDIPLTVYDYLTLGIKDLCARNDYDPDIQREMADIVAMNARELQSTLVTMRAIMAHTLESISIARN